MTLDDAIVYYDRKAIDCEQMAINISLYDDEHFGYLYDASLECKQLADWLNELKMLRERIVQKNEENKWILCGDKNPNETGWYLVSEVNGSISRRYYSKNFGWSMTKPPEAWTKFKPFKEGIIQE